MTFRQRVTTAFAVGLILNFASEMLFYSAPAQETALSAYAITMLVYGIAAYATLLVAAWAGVRDWPGVFLSGCIFGWLIEGVVMGTVYSALPFTLVFTAMSWHALLSVLLGFVMVRRSARWPLGRQIGLMLLLGFGFGVWAQFWPLERNLMPGAGATFLYLLGLGLTVPIANHMLDGLPTRFPFRRADALIIWGLAGLFWATKLATSGNPALLVLPLAMGPTLWLLRRGGAHGGVVVIPERPDNPARHWLFLITPGLTFLMAITGWPLFNGLPSNAIIAVVSSLIAVGFWLFAGAKALRKNKK